MFLQGAKCVEWWSMRIFFTFSSLSEKQKLVPTIWWYIFDCRKIQPTWECFNMYSYLKILNVKLFTRIVKMHYLYVHQIVPLSNSRYKYWFSPDTWRTKKTFPQTTTTYLKLKFCDLVKNGRNFWYLLRMNRVHLKFLWGSINLAVL